MGLVGPYVQGLLHSDQTPVGSEQREMTQGPPHPLTCTMAAVMVLRKRKRARDRISVAAFAHETQK